MESIQAIKQRFSIIGNDTGLNRALEKIKLVAPTDISVLVTGESGVGKENIPRIAHQLSHRKHAKYIAVNCGAIPEGTIDSELFGHEKGAFTGAIARKEGVFEQADGGTLFLDEVTEMPIDMQPNLLRVLETKKVTRVGGNRELPINCRVISATNRSLTDLAQNNIIREDIYFRLAVFPIDIPALRERKEDIPLLAKAFLEQLNDENGTSFYWLNEQLKELQQYEWPGNVRELEHVISRAALRAKANSPHQAIVSLTSELLEITSDKPVSSLAELDTNPANSLPNMSLKAATEAFQKRIIAHALQQADGNWAMAAKQLQMDRSNLIRMAKRLNISIQKTTKVTFN